jgi:hypothetical protein
MNEKSSLSISWIKTGVISGLLACFIYPIMIFIELPQIFTLLLAGSFGPILSVASIGLYFLINIHKKTVTLQLAVLFNIIGGTIVNMMLLVQMAIRTSVTNYLNGVDELTTRELINWIFKIVDKVQLGLDVSWDLFIAVGTLLFAINMLNHPRFGKIIGGAGILISLLLLLLNLLTFPETPADSGLIDLGPFIGLWYLIVTIVVFFSIKWAREQINYRESF